MPIQDLRDKDFTCEGMGKYQRHYHCLDIIKTFDNKLRKTYNDKERHRRKNFQTFKNQK